MQRTLNIKACFLTAVLSVFAAGTACTEEEMMHEAPGKDRMSFAVSFSDKWEIPDTRAVPTTTGNFKDKIESFGVYAYTYTGNLSNASDAELYIDGDEAKSSGSIWDFESPRFWPGEGYLMKFFAYAPYASDNMTVSDNDGVPSVSYTVDTDSRSHKDLLVTTEMVDAAGNYNRTLSLEFQHILTAVNVKGSGPLTKTVTSITFSGIKQSGTYTYGNSQWTSSGNETSVSCNNLNKILSRTESDIISDTDGTTFLMIPQTLGPDAKIEVEISGGKSLSASLAGREWPMGKRVTYVIYDTGINLALDVRVEEYWEFGADSNLEI